MTFDSQKPSGLDPQKPLGLLILNLRKGEGFELRLGDLTIDVYLADAGNRKARIAIRAPKFVKVLRHEIMAAQTASVSAEVKKP